MEIENGASTSYVFYEVIPMDHLTELGSLIADQGKNGDTEFYTDLKNFFDEAFNIKTKTDELIFSYQNHVFDRIREISPIIQDIIEYAEDNKDKTVQMDSTIDKVHTAAASMRGLIQNCYRKIEKKMMPASSRPVIGFIKAAINSAKLKEDGGLNTKRRKLFQHILSQIKVSLSEAAAQIEKKDQHDGLSQSIKKCIDINSAFVRHQLEVARAQLLPDKVLPVQVPAAPVHEISDIGYNPKFESENRAI